MFEKQGWDLMRIQQEQQDQPRNIMEILRALEEELEASAQEAPALPAPKAASAHMCQQMRPMYRQGMKGKK